MRLPWTRSDEERTGKRRTVRRFAWFIHRTRRPAAAASAFLLPEVHVYESEKVIQVRVEGHDLDPKRIQIRRQGNSLILSGLVRVDARGATRLYRRAIVLPPSADASAVTASLRPGLLLIRVPKKPAVGAASDLTRSETL